MKCIKCEIGRAKMACFGMLLGGKPNEEIATFLTKHLDGEYYVSYTPEGPEQQSAVFRRNEVPPFVPYRITEWK
jgi:hypothetical protein